MLIWAFVGFKGSGCECRMCVVCWFLHTVWLCICGAMHMARVFVNEKLFSTPCSITLDASFSVFPVSQWTHTHMHTHWLSQQGSRICFFPNSKPGVPLQTLPDVDIRICKHTCLHVRQCLCVGAQMNRWECTQQDTQVSTLKQTHIQLSACLPSYWVNKLLGTLMMSGFPPASTQDVSAIDRFSCGHTKTMTARATINLIHKKHSCSASTVCLSKMDNRMNFIANTTRAFCATSPLQVEQTSDVMGLPSSSFEYSTSAFSIF